MDKQTASEAIRTADENVRKVAAGDSNHESPANVEARAAAKKAREGVESPE